MRKFTLLMLTFVCTMVAWAAPITELSDAVVGKVFTIRAKDQNRGAFVYHESYSTEYLSGSKRTGYGDLSSADKNFLFTFVKEDGKYFLYSLGAARYCAYAENGVALQVKAPADGVSFLASEGGDKENFPTVIAIDGSHQLNMSDNQQCGILTNWNNLSDDGNMLAIEEVSGKEICDFKYQYTNGEDVLATLQIYGLIGEDYPAPYQPLGIDATTPTGKIDSSAKGTTKKVGALNANFPFKFFSSYAEIDTWYAAKLHSNQTNYVYYAGNVIASTDSYSAENMACAWAFVGNPVDGFKMYNRLGGDGAMLDSKNPCSLSVGNYIVKAYASSAVTMADGGFCLKFDGQQYLNLQSGRIKRWGSADEGSTWKLEKIDYSSLTTDNANTAKTEALAIVNSSSILFGDPATDGTAANTAKKAIEGYVVGTDIAAAIEFYNKTINTMCAGVDKKDVVFYNTNRDNRYMVVVDAVQLAGANAADGRSIFRIKNVGANFFTIQNLATERFIASTPNASRRIQLSQTAGAFKIKSFGTDNKFAFICTTPNDADKNSLHLDGSFNVVAWNADTEGNASVWIVQEPASGLDLDAAKDAVKNQAWSPANTLKSNLANVQIGSGLGQYSGEEANITAFNNAMNAIPASIEGKSYEELVSLNDVKNNLQTAYNALQINQPNLKAFTVQAKQTGRYLSLCGIDLESVGTKYAKIVSGQENADIFLLTSENKMVSYNAGLGITNTEELALPGTDINTMTFTKGANAGCYAINTDRETWSYFYWNNNDRLYAWDGKCDNADWTLTEVAELPIKMNQVDGAWYATFNVPVRVVIPEGLRAYSAEVSTENENVLNLTKIVENGVLAANTPVILYSKSEVTSLAISSEEGTGTKSSVLAGTNQKITAPAGTNYVLGKNAANKVGFYKYTAANMPAFKAYMNTAAAEGREFTFNMDDIETSIDAIESDNSEAVIYDLAGRRVQKAAKGLYIVNGKKVMYN